MDCSVVLSVCNEIPHVFYTIQSLMNELDGYCKYEIIVIDNLSTDTFTIGKKSYTLEEALTDKNADETRNIKYVKYSDKRSHWNAKNKGIELATGRNVFFLDAHCIIGRDSLRKQIEFLDSFDGKIGGVHCYHRTMMGNRKIFEHDCRKVKFLYRFRRAQTEGNFKQPYEVAHMSTCGMMVQKKVLNELGGWNKELGTRWGGEYYFNLKHGVCGYPHYILPETHYNHHKHEYGYGFSGLGGYRSIMIGAYSVGGEEWLDYFLTRLLTKKGITQHPNKYDDMAAEVRSSCKEDREFIASKQIMTLTEFYKKWGML